MAKGDRDPVLEAPVVPVSPSPRLDNPSVDTAAAAEVSDMAAKLGKDATLAIENVDVDPRLTRYKEDYDTTKNSVLKAFPWAEIQNRLLANEGHYLTRAQTMEQGGQLFGVDKQGRPLISDRGDEPIMKGMNYKNTRDRVLYKHDRNDINGKLIPGEDGQPQLTGYEMFGYAGDYDKSDEIDQYETHTGKHFVQSRGGYYYRSSWLESGENPSSPGIIRSFPNIVDSSVYYDSRNSSEQDRGVRRLLRLEKAA